AHYSPVVVYGINGASFLTVITALLMMRSSGKPAETGAERGRVNIKSVLDGLSFVWNTPIIVQTMTLDFIATFFASATTLLPIFADQILRVGARGLGFLAAAPAVGSLVTGLVMARARALRRQGPTVLIAVALYGAATIGFGLSKVFALSLAMLAIVGASDTVSTVLRQTIRQMVTPNHLRGRMTSVNQMFFMGGPQLGEFEAGALARFLGAPLSVVVGGIGCVIAVGLAAMKAKNLIKYDSHLEPRREEAPAPAAD
ncbi:MAG: MFS transporter, partial [Blastocatellia bacterium]